VSLPWDIYPGFLLQSTDWLPIDWKAFRRVDCMHCFSCKTRARSCWISP
jgi:hypothetical protein